MLLFQPAQLDTAMGWWCKQLLKANPELELGQLVLFKHELRKCITEAATAYPLLMSLDHTPKGMMKMALEAGGIAPDTLPRGMEMQLGADGSIRVKAGLNEKYHDINAHSFAKRVQSYVKALAA